tara:strand:+ start:38 stop:652 length:615 start_codon:yes stop_codon:yes gene_type:complete
LAYIGKTPTPVPLTSSDIVNGIITGEKLNADVISSQTALAVAPADTDEFLISDAGVLKRLDASLIGGGGKIGQVLSATDETLRSTTSTSFVTASNTLSVDITPAATSSKIFITTDFSSGASTNNQVGQFTIYRDSTNLGNAEGMVKFASYVGGDNYFPIGMNFLDSPSSTSQLTYQVRLKVNTGTSYINYGAMKCSITVMEVLA